MKAIISQVLPGSPEAVELVGEIVRDVASAYPAQNRFGLSPEQLAAEGVAFFVTHADGALAGCGGVKLCADGYAEIKRLYVRPAFRGRGLAKMMMGCLEQYVRDLGFRMMRLETGVFQREAISLYERLGYREIPPFGPYRETPVNRFYEKCLSEPENQ